MTPPRAPRRSRKSSADAWTTQLTEAEVRRRWGVDVLEIVTWRERFPRPGGGMATRDRDLLGLVDGLVFPEDGGTIALQWTSWSNVPAHERKASAEPRLEFMRRAGWEFLIWGWRVTGSKPELREVRVLPST